MASLQTPTGVDLATYGGLAGSALAVDQEQVRNTIRASTVGTVALVSGTAPFFSLYGSATKLVRLRRLFFVGTIATAAANVILALSKRSTAISAGTPSAMTALPMDANDTAPTALAQAFTAAPTPGTLVATLQQMRALLNITGAVATQDVLFDFTQIGAKPPTLRGVAQGVDLSFAVAPGNIVQGAMWAEWTEE